MINDPPVRPVVGRFCPQCGAQGRDGDRFCGACGESLALDLPLPSVPEHHASSGDEPDTIAFPIQRVASAATAGEPSPGSGADVPLEPFTLPAWVKKVPASSWALTALAVLVFFVGVGIYQSNVDMAESCTVSEYGSFYVIEDTPTCDAATDDRDLGQTLMGGGAIVAVAVPIGALSRRKPGTATAG